MDRLTITKIAGKVTGTIIGIVLIVVVMAVVSLFQGPSCSVRDEPPKAAKELRTFEVSRVKAGFDGYLKLNGYKKFVALNLKSVDFKSNSNNTAVLSLNFDCAEMMIKFTEMPDTTSFASDVITLTSNQLKLLCKLNDVSITGAKRNPFRVGEEVAWICYDLSEQPNKTLDHLIVYKILVDLHNKSDSK